MDLSTLQPTTRPVPLLHPKTDKELGITFQMRSRLDPEVQAAEREWQNALYQKRRFNITAEALDAAKEKQLMAAVVGWEWTDPEFTFRGEQPEFSPKVFRQMLREVEYVREFLNIELANDAAFF